MFRKRAAARRQQLERDIAFQIRQRTNGHVRQLEVKVSNGQIIVSGHSDSYYTKQLAMEGIVDVLGAVETGVLLDIEVHSPEVKAVDMAYADAPGLI